MSQLTNELRLLRLERRIERIERQLHIPPPLDTTPLDVSSDEVRAASSAPMPADATQAARDRHVNTTATTLSSITMATPPIVQAAPIVPGAPDVEMAAPPPLPMDSRVSVPASEPAAGRDAPGASMLKPLAYEGEATRQANAVRPRALEQTIGLKWAGWIGAVVLVIGGILGVKYAIDQHWFGAMPPAIQLSFIVAAGLALLGAGEYVYRRVHTVPAASLFGAGVATLFVAAYVGYAYHKLYSGGTSLTLMSMATLLGAAVAMRGNLVSIAVLSLIGGNIAPMLVAHRDSPLVPFLCYLLMLEIVALVLAWWGARDKWWTLRGLSLATTALWTAGALLGSHGSEHAIVPFMIAYAALYHAELIASALRRIALPNVAPRNVAMPSVALSNIAQQNIAPPNREGGARSVPGVTFALVVTTVLTVGVLWFHRHDTNAARATWTLALSIATALLGFGLPRLGERLRPLAMAHRTAAAALLIVTVPLALTGVRVEIGWLVLSVAFASMFATTRSTISRSAALATWALAVLRILIVAGRQWGRSEPGADDVWLTILGTAIGSATVMSWIAAIGGHVIARLMTTNGESGRETAGGSDDVNERRAALSVSSISGALALSVFASLLFVATAIASLPALGSSAAIIAYAWVLIAVHRIAPSLQPAMQGAGLLVLVAVKWAAIDTLANRLAPGWSPKQYLPLLNPQMAVGGAAIASLAGMYFLRERFAHERFGRSDRRRLNQHEAGTPSFSWLAILAAAVIGMLTIGLSFEVERTVERVAAGRSLAWPIWQAKHMAWTMLWCAASCGFAFAIASLAGDEARRRIVGRLWLLPALLAMKYVIVDTMFWRFTGGGRGTFGTVATAMPLVNVQLLAGIVVIGSIVFARWIGAGAAHGDAPDRLRGMLPAALAILIGWMGTLEIDRAFHTITSLVAAVKDPALAEQVALSIFWASFAVGAVIVGFVIRAASLRYFGLTLLAITLFKIVVVDLRSVETGYRILSFIGLGLLLLGTSVVYGKVSPKLLREPKGQVDAASTAG